jgi:acyl-CoA thioesterase-1
MKEEQRKYVEKTRRDLESGADATIVCFGDSITAGYAVRRGFPSFLLESLRQRFPDSKIEMINSGICGDTSQDGLGRLDWAVLSYEPDLVTINFGINDCVLVLSLEEFEMNLVEMVRRIRAGPDSEILLLSSQPLESPPYDRGYWTTIRRWRGWQKR